MSAELKIQPSRTANGPRPTHQKGVPIPPEALGELLGRAATVQSSLPEAVASELAALGGPVADNPLNLQRVKDATEIPVPRPFRFARVRLEVAGYSNAKLSQASGYRYDEVMRGIVAGGGEGKVGLLVSPTADPGSIDAATTGAAFQAEMPLLSVTAEPYAKYINPESLGSGISKERYLAQPKYVLPDTEAYVKANAELTNAWLALGGGDVAGKAFRHHVELDHPIVLIDDGRGPCLSVEALRSDNGSAWLADKVARQLSGRPLHSVCLGGAEHTYSLAETVKLGKEAAAAAKRNGTTVASELAKSSSVPPEAVADAMMFEKSGLSEEWLKQNLASKDDIRLSVLKLNPKLTPERAGAMAIELLGRYLERR